MKFEKMKKLQCENVKINRMIVIFTELFKVHLTCFAQLVCCSLEFTGLYWHFSKVFKIQLPLFMWNNFRKYCAMCTCRSI